MLKSLSLHSRHSASKLFSRFLRVVPFLFLLLFSAVVFKASYRMNYARYANFNSSKFDLGNMAQAVWNVSRGHNLEFTDLFGNNIPRLAVHADLLMALFAPAFWVWQEPAVLLFLQCVLLASSSIPLYFLAQRAFKSDWLSLIWGAALFFYPAFQYLLLSDFHAVSLVIPLFFWSFLFLEKNKTAPFWICVVLALLAKEEISLLVFMFGLYIAIFRKRRNLGLGISALGLVWALFLFFAVFPYYGELRVKGQQEFIKLLQANKDTARTGIVQNHFLTRYSHFGSSYFEIIKNLLLHPVNTLSYIFNPENCAFMFKIFAPVGFLSFLSPAVFAISLPEFAVNLLSNSYAMKMIQFQYTSAIIPFVFLSALYGVEWLSSRCQFICAKATTRVATTVLSLFMLFSCIWGMRQFDSPLWLYFKSGGPLVKFESALVYVQEFLGPDKQVEDITGGIEEEQIPDVEDEESVEEENLIGKEIANIPYSNPKHNGAAQAVVDLIPQDPEVSVSAPHFLGVHLSLRKTSAMFPSNYLDSDYTVVDLVHIPFLQLYENYDIAELIPYYVRNLLNNRDYSLVYSGNGLLVFSRFGESGDSALQINEIHGSKDGKIDFEKGLSLTGWDIPDKIVRNKTTMVSFNYSVDNADFARKIIVTSLQRKEDGDFYQEVHIPSFAMLPTNEWELGKVYEEKFEFILPGRVPEGEYNYILSVVDFGSRESIESRLVKQVVVK